MPTSATHSDKSAFDAKSEAKKILIEHTAGYMSAVTCKPASAHDLWTTVTNECATILTEKLINGEYTPMQYNDVRNELGDLINGIFGEDCD